MTVDADTTEIAELIRAFTLATDRVVPREMAALMCADEAEAFLDNVADPDLDGQNSFDTEPIEVLGVRVLGDIALARITRPSFSRERTMVCRRERGSWTVCVDAEDELSLEQLDDDVRIGPAGATAVQRRVHDLRRQPIGSLTTEDTRILLTHNEGLDHLLPRAAAQLGWEPLLQGGSHPGDLLMAVLGVDKTQWSKDPISLVYVRSAINRLRDIGDPSIRQAPHDKLWHQIAIFQADHPDTEL